MKNIKIIHLCIGSKFLVISDKVLILLVILIFIRFFMRSYSHPNPFLNPSDGERRAMGTAATRTPISAMSHISASRSASALPVSIPSILGRRRRRTCRPSQHTTARIASRSVKRCVTFAWRGPSIVWWCISPVSFPPFPFRLRSNQT